MLLNHTLNITQKLKELNILKSLNICPSHQLEWWPQKKQMIGETIGPKQILICCYAKNIIITNKLYFRG